MVNDFNKHSEQGYQQLEQAFSGPLGPMLGKMGVLSQEQQDESGLVQAQMIAVRTAIETNVITYEQATEALGEFRGNLDFGTLAKSPADTRHKTLETLGIAQTDIADAERVVAKAQATQSNVNANHDMQVSPIGFIHTDLHAKDIPNFGGIKQGALIAQRAIDTAHSINRINNNEPNLEASGKRGFKLWGDETPQLAGIVACAQELHAKEGLLESNERPLVSIAHVQTVQDAFDDAAQTFEDAGQYDLAHSITRVRDHLISNQADNNDPSTSPDDPGL